MDLSQLPTEQQLDLYQGCLWLPGDLIEVRAFPAERGTAPAKNWWMEARDLKRHADEFAVLNRQGYGIYAGVLPRTHRGGRTDGDCLPGHVVWADLDGGVMSPEALKRAEEGELPEPTLVVMSGHGTHLYWGLLQPIEPEKLRELVWDLAVLLGGDESVKNPSRVMRLPGFKNTKEPVADCRIVRARPEKRYEF